MFHTRYSYAITNKRCESRSSFQDDRSNWRWDWPLQKDMVALLKDGGALLPFAEGTTVSFQPSLPQGEGKGNKPFWISRIVTVGGLWPACRDLMGNCSVFFPLCLRNMGMLCFFGGVFFNSTIKDVPNTTSSVNTWWSRFHFDSHSSVTYSMHTYTHTLFYKQTVSFWRLL